MAYTRVTRTANGRGALMYAAGHAKGHNGHEQRNAMVGYVNLLPGVDPADQMQTRWNKARKNHTTQVLRIVQSFSRNELNPDNPEDILTANMIGQEFVQKHYPNRQAMVFTQIDGKSGLVHNHVIISDTDLIASKGCTKDQYYFPKIMEWTNEIAGQYMELDFGDKTEDKTTQTERHKREVGEYVWKDDLKSRITESMQVSETEEDWISNLTKYGVNVEVHDSKKRGKYYTYELMDTSKFPDGKKIPANLKSRSYKLGTRYDAEEIESYFLKKEQELQKQKAVQREVPEEKVRRQEPRTKLQEQEPVSPAPKPVHRVKQKPAQKPVARPAMPKPKVPAQTTNIVRLIGEDDIDDMTDVVDEPVSRDDTDWMALALERKMRQDAKKNREKTQERLNTVRKDASYMTRLRSSDVVARIRNVQREDDNSPDL